VHEQRRFGMMTTRALGALALRPDDVIQAKPSSAAAVKSRRALVLDDRPLVVDLIGLALRHGPFAVRAGHAISAKRLSGLQRKTGNLTADEYERINRKADKVLDSDPGE